MSNLIYLYGLVPTEEMEKESLSNLTGFDGTSSIYSLPIGDITAIVCALPADDYNAATIESKLNQDMEWLQNKAFHHHETITALHQQYTFIPLKFCTIYEDTANLYETIRSNEKQLTDSFQTLHASEEWTLKIYCNEQKLRESIKESDPEIEKQKEEITKLPRGRQFFEKKKIDSLVGKQLDQEKDRFGETLHRLVKDVATNYTVKKNWNKDMTGLKEEMVWNSAYLVPKEKVENFINIILRFEKEQADTVWRIEATGPWPAYHFSDFSQSEAKSYANNS
ncbi:Gas vesicle synthesis protein GvpL/GvpF [Oceanobacillus picturae]|uniref:Gas vesicle synthesis protein GvpL/GvpF n=1 Tax=Oceanobacillus picturae TaxID=171693 RepID=W9BFA3_9BACI|nr:GvpL/GvpF family gas vesicle protein [Oceanobacillus picturae]CDO05015.1 Gas vesicle synthesis protein GvpL/GvpF [Oceanobacillus picturae]